MKASFHLIEVHVIRIEELRIEAVVGVCNLAYFQILILEDIIEQVKIAYLAWVMTFFDKLLDESSYGHCLPRTSCTTYRRRLVSQKGECKVSVLYLLIHKAGLA